MRCAIKSLGLTACLAFATVVPSWAQISNDDIKSAYAAARSALTRLIGEDGNSSDPQAEVLEQRAWWMEARWILNFLDAHPAATPDILDEAVRDGLATVPVETFQLDGSSFLIVIEDTFFVARRGREGFEISWNLREDAKNRALAGKVAWVWANGPATGGVDAFVLRMLPSDAEGHRRFYIDAHRWQGAGEHGTYQLSIWSWERGAMKLLFAKEYLGFADDPWGSFDGKYLHIAAESSWKVFDGLRRFDWRLRIGPRTVKDAGIVNKDDPPLFSFYDELFDRLFHGKSAGDLGSNRAISELQPIVRRIMKTAIETFRAAHAEVTHAKPDKPSDWAHELVDYQFLGDITDWGADRDTACLAVRPPGSDHQYTFLLDIRRPHGQPYVSKARVITDIKCEWAYDYTDP